MPYKIVASFNNTVLYCVIFSLLIFSACNNKENNTNQQDAIFAFDDNADIRWSSPENRDGTKGAGGKETTAPKDMPMMLLKQVNLILYLKPMDLESLTGYG